MRSFLRAPAVSLLDDEEWQAEKALWGLESDDEEEEELIPIWDENWDVVMWWLSIPSFLKWNFNRCVGMDVMAVKADAEMSSREINPADYQKLKVIARTVTEEFNERK
ncbi:hypothetical protein [Vibrio cincinnatiensis]|uniref:hypothetical protein n=1 Tax=Vibrio cincinnatiensis TaxID=675 RepID=UPI001FAA8219|nr:hypothetical protein [Vibrio cincinnatiensis]